MVISTDAYRKQPILIVENLHKSFKQSFRKKKILNGIDFQIETGEIVALVGESGCGKTTIAMCIAGLLGYDEGKIHIAGKHLDKTNKKEKNIWLRKHLQLIFQNTKGTLNERKNIGKIFNESIRSIQKLTKKEIKCDIPNLLKKVDLDETILTKNPKAFSGGECQRISIARALLVDPKLIIADEPISSSDVTTQAKILNLFKKISEDGISILFITHDIVAAHYLSQRIMVMKDGKIIEQNESDEIINNPETSYTKELITFS